MIANTRLGYFVPSFVPVLAFFCLSCNPQKQSLTTVKGPGNSSITISAGSSPYTDLHPTIIGAARQPAIHRLRHNSSGVKQHHVFH